VPSPIPLIFLAFFLVWLQAFFQASAQMPTRGIYSDVTLPYLTLFSLQPSQIHVPCSLTAHEMSFAVLPVFNCVSTPSVVRPWHGTPGPPLLVICVKLKMMFLRWAACHFSLTHPHVVSLQIRRRFATLFSETRVQDVFAFLHQNNNKLQFFLHELIAFYKQASGRAYWLRKAFFL